MNRNTLIALRALCAAVVAGPCGLAHAQTIVKTAQLNPDTYHRYVMISATSWEAAQTWARARGADLATIDDASEELWVWNTFSGTASKYMIGLKADGVGNMAWSSGSSSDYRNWEPGEPKVTSNSRYTCVINQKWSVRNTNYAPFYVVEWNAGPVRVPEEYATLAGALAAMVSSGETELVVGPGSYTIPTTVTLTSQWWRPGSITGAGNDVTEIVYSGGAGGVGLSGDWTIKDAKWSRSGNSQIFYAKSGVISLEGLRIDGRNSSNFYGLVQIDPNAQLSVRRCRIRQAASVFGTGTSAAVQVSDSIIDDAGILTGVGMNSTFSNCTLVRVGINGFSLFLGRTRLINSILWDTTGLIGDSVSATNCNYHNFVIPGKGNFSVDPYWDPVTYELLEGSPCIDAGSISAMNGSALDVAGRPRVFGGGPDVGASEFMRGQCEADFNGDGFIDFYDFDEFVAAFEGGC